MPIEFGNLRLYSLEEISQAFKEKDTGRGGVTTVTLRSYIKQGELKARKCGGTWYVTEEALREYFESGSSDEQEQGSADEREV